MLTLGKQMAHAIIWAAYGRASVDKPIRDIVAELRAYSVDWRDRAGSNEVVLRTIDELERLRNDPNLLPLSDIPPDWRINCLQEQPDVPAPKRWFCELAHRQKRYRHVHDTGPTPREAVLAAVARIGG